VFRQGVHKYLEAHMYGNATAEDFWSAQTETSGKPIDKVMDSFITEPGVPLLTFSSPKKGSTSVSQQRFFLDPETHADHPQTWTVPACFRAGDTPKCELLSAAQQKLSVPDADFFFANANDRGYYRTLYDAADYNKILSMAETELSPAVRIGFAGNEWALMRSGRSSIGNYLDLASVLRNDPNADVIENIAGAIGATDERIATPEDRVKLAAWVRQEFRPSYDQVKEISPSDSVEKKQLRATLFGVLGEIGRDPQIIAQAKELTNKYIADQASVEPSLVRPAVMISTENGDSHLFDQLQQLSKTSNNPDVKITALVALSNFHNPTLVRRALDYATSGQVRNQDAIFLFVVALRSRDTRQIAWDYIQKNWDKVHAQMTTMMGGYLVQSTGSFCSAEKGQEVQTFFTSHPVAAAQQAIQRATNSIHNCTVLRATQQPKLTEWLAKQHLPAGGM
jgi:aminopeptidase N/puromycin-sensitive aminopeptidase